MGSSSSVREVTAADSYHSSIDNPKQQENSQVIKVEADSKPKNVGDDNHKVDNTDKDVDRPKTTVTEADKSNLGSDETGKDVKTEPPPLSRDEIEAMKKEILEIIETHINMMKDVDWLDENGRYNTGAKKLLYGFSISYFALKRATLPDMIESRRQITSACLKTDILTKICGVVIETYPKGWEQEDGKTDMEVWNPLKNALLLLLNFSDASHEFAERMGHTPGFLEMIRIILKESVEPHLKQDSTVTVNRHKAMKWSLSITHNCSMVESNIPRLRSLNFTEVLVPYLDSPEKMYQLNCLASLAAIIDEKESEILNRNNDSVKFLMEVLQNGLNEPSRRYNGWSCKESALTVRMLARNDTNKKLLVELGTLELLVELAKGSIEEQIEAVGAIWALSFDEENRKVMVNKEELDVVSTLLILKSSEDLKVKASANGTLWNLRVDLEKTEGFHELGEHLSNGRHKNGKKKKKKLSNEEDQQAEKEEELGHVMISYQWGNQKVLTEIRDKLIDNGLKVWMDIDQMGGSTLQAMADAVENASIVLMAMSQKYKDSPNCRAEAEYAFQQRKKIVPLMMERGYKPDGWLGFILGAKLFYDFSGKYAFQDKINDLLKEMKRIKGQPQTAQNEVIVPKKTEPNYHQPVVVDIPDSYHPGPSESALHKSADKVRNWMADDVKNWINKNTLPVQKFGNLTPGEVALLLTMRKEAPEAYYRCVQDMLKVTDLWTLSKLYWALADIEK